MLYEVITDVDIQCPRMFAIAECLGTGYSNLFDFIPPVESKYLLEDSTFDAFIRNLNVCAITHCHIGIYQRDCYENHGGIETPNGNQGDAKNSGDQSCRKAY